MFLFDSEFRKYLSLRVLYRVMRGVDQTLPKPSMTNHREVYFCKRQKTGPVCS